MSSIRTPLTVSPHEYFGDITGRPLDYGTIYFGEPDKDPEFYPIDVYSDEALTQPIPQPIRTKGGFINVNGDIIEIFGRPAIYSVKVLDQYGRKIFYKGKAMRNNVNDDIIAEIDAAIQQSKDDGVEYAKKAVREAIDDTVTDGSPIADTMIAVDGSLSQRTINKGLESIADLSTIKNPKDGLRVYVKSYHAGLGKGGGYFTYDSSKSAENDGGTVVDGWVRDETNEMSVLDFGATGDGVTDDTLAIENAIKSEKPIDFLDGTYKIKAPITHTYTGGTAVTWNSKDAAIIYDGEHTEYVIRLVSNSDVTFISNGSLLIDAQKQANKGLEIISNDPKGVNTKSFVSFENMTIKSVKRLRTFNDGDCLIAKGSFKYINLKNCVFNDAELPEGQGISGSKGIFGVSVMHNGYTSYCKRFILDNCTISNIYSSDIDYLDDQDGVRFLTAQQSDGSLVQATFIAKNCDFINCFNRSIKTQCKTTRLQGNTYTRTDGLNSTTGAEADVQYGSLYAKSEVFDYSGFTSGVCYHLGSSDTHKSAGFSIDSVNVYLSDGLELPAFASTYPRGNASFPNISIANIGIYGKCTAPVVLRINGSNNRLAVTNLFVEDIGTYPISSNSALVTVLASGGAGHIQVTTKDCTVLAKGKSIAVSHSISGVRATAASSESGNIGFLDMYKSGALVQYKGVDRVGRIGVDINNSMPNSPYIEVLGSASLKNEEEYFFRFSSYYGATIFINAGSSIDDFAQVYTFRGECSEIVSGSGFAVGKSSKPETNEPFKVWGSGWDSEGNVGVHVSYSGSVARVITVFAMCAY